MSDEETKGRIVNKRELSEIFGVSERTYTDWQKKGMPILEDNGRGSSNQYNTCDVATWMRIEAARDAGKGDEKAKDRLDRVRGDKLELEIAEQLKQMVPVAELEMLLGGAVLACKALLTAKDETLKIELDSLYGIDVDLELLNEHTRNTLEQLAVVGTESINST